MHVMTHAQSRNSDNVTGVPDSFLFSQEQDKCHRESNDTNEMQLHIHTYNQSSTCFFQ